MSQEDQVKNIDSLLSKLEQKEKKLKKRTILFSALPILLAILLIFATSSKISKQIEYSNELENKISELELRLNDATNFVKNVHDIDWGDTKVLASLYPAQSRLLLEILEMKDRGVKWKIDGYSVEDGFDSPSFAAYILNQLSLASIPIKDRYNISNYLPHTSTPNVGDLIFYETGYTMFYFKDKHDEPFCIGMTPIGIVSLKIDFGPKLINYGHIEY